MTTQDALLSGEHYERYRAGENFSELVQGGIVTPTWENGDVFTFTDTSVTPPKTYRVDPLANTKTEIETPLETEPAVAANPFATLMSEAGFSSPDGRYAVKVDAHDLVLGWNVDGRTEHLTSDGTEQLSWAPALSMPGGALDTIWAANSARFVAMQSDHSGVNRSPVVRWLKAREEVEWRVMPRPGERTSRNTLNFVDVTSKTLTPIEGTGLENHTYYAVGWQPDGTRYLFMRMDRRMQQLDLMAADPRTGASRVLITDTSDTYIAGLDFLMRYPRYCRLVNGGEKILWISERTGWDQLYLYDSDGKLEKQLTPGDFVILDVLEVAGDWVYFTGHTDKSRPYDVHVCRVGLDGTGFAQLTDGDGRHAPLSILFQDGVLPQFSPSKRFFLDTFSSATTPPRTVLRAADGTPLQTLAEASIDELIEAGFVAPEEFTAKAADGVTDLYGIVCKPPHFDPSKSYPVLDHIYNGPFVSWVPGTFEGSLSKQGQHMANAGYVVVVVDGRGTTSRGKAFQDVHYMNWGRHEIPDHEAAIRSAASTRPYMDLDRVGVFGGSWGGYMTQRAMLLAPDFYKVGISFAPVADLYDHTLNLEWYVGLPQDNREVYDFASNLLRAKDLKGKLLLIHGTLDLENAPFSATMKLVDALIRAEKQFDLAVVPEMAHGASAPHHRRWVADLHFRYFAEHLGSARSL